MVRGKLIAIFIFVLPFFTASFSFAAEENNTHVAMSRSEETLNELLLFWDEKDLYVQTATRSVKSISQVAENMSVVTAKDIEEMNAHTVNEVLNRVTGVFVDMLGGDFGSTALIRIQGSEERHVLVLLDGIPWNFMAGGNAVVNTIPVQIIERIEIVKGPASSAWGSALGGVVNIITKEPVRTGPASGTLSGSFGESDTQDYSAQVSGKTGTLGYYLFAGRQHSDGHIDGRDYDNYSLYSKFSLPVSDTVKLGLTLGYSEPDGKVIDSPTSDITNRVRLRAFFATASLDADVTGELKAKVYFYTYNNKLSSMNDALGMGFNGAEGDLFQDIIADEKTIGGSAKLIWTHGMHSAVLGMDASHGKMDFINKYGQVIQSFGIPATTSVSPEIDKWAVFLNDTIAIGKFSVTPGIRYDDNTVTGSFVSPSIGATYKLAEKTILRASVARGFTIPPLAWTSAGGLFLDPNPDLKPEKVWSYQAGIESGVTDYLWVKATVFRHDLSDNIVKEFFAGGPPGCVGSACNDLFVNKGDVTRQGIELELETVPFYNFSFRGGFALYDKDPSDGQDLQDYAWNLALKYDDRKSFMAQLFGHYMWWDPKGISPFAPNPEYHDFIWELNLRKKIFTTEKNGLELFMTAHNIFNGSQYQTIEQRNPDRWFEAGVRFKF